MDSSSGRRAMPLAAHSGIRKLGIDGNVMDVMVVSVGLAVVARGQESMQRWSRLAGSQRRRLAST